MNGSLPTQLFRYEDLLAYFGFIFVLWEEENKRRPFLCIILRL